MQTSKKSWRLVGLILFGVLVCEGVFLSRSPDVTLTLDRRLRSSLTPDRIDRNVASPSRWTQWFYSLAQVVGPESLQKGALLTLKIDPKKGQKKKFELQAEVIDYIPSRLLHLKITDDSSGRITHLFDHLEWKLEIEPTEKGSILRGSAMAHTHHWRARFFGRMAEKILMNQVFYPNLIQLADLKQPYAIDEAPHLPAGSL